MCEGVMKNSERTLNHVVYLKTNLNLVDVSPVQAKIYIHSLECLVLIKEIEGKCNECKMYERRITKQNEKLKCIIETPAKLKAPLNKTHPLKIQLALQNERIKNKQLEQEIAKLRREIQTQSFEISKNLSEDVQNILNNNSEKLTPFMKLFWQQHNLVFSGKRVHRYHPLVIRFCLSIASKSSSAYEELRDSHILTLPSQRILRSYKNVIHPTTGFNSDVVQELQKMTMNYHGVSRFATLSFDEMKIQSDLVFDKHTGELIGFVDLGNYFHLFSDVSTLCSDEKLCARLENVFSQNYLRFKQLDYCLEF